MEIKTIIDGLIERGMNYEATAKNMGVSPRTIRRWHKGETHANFSEIKALEELLKKTNKPTNFPMSST